MPWDLRLEGTASDRVAYVTCNLTFDPEGLSVSQANLGRMLALPAKLEMKLSLQGGPRTIYQDGEIRLTSLNGWIGLPRSSWSRPIPEHIQPSGQDQWVSLAVPLSDSDLEAMEDARSGGDLWLNMFIGGVAQLLSKPQTYGGNPVPYRQSETITLVSDSGGPAQGGGRSGLKVRRDKWLELLGQTGHRRVLVELPFPNLPEHDKAWDEAMRHLSEATDAHRSGRHEDVLKGCRQVVDGVAETVGRQWGFPRGKKRYQQWTTEMAQGLGEAWGPADKEKAVMVGSLLNATWAWTSPSHHTGPVPKREEAAFALNLTTGLLSFVAQVMKAYPNVSLAPDQDAMPEQ